MTKTENEWVRSFTAIKMLRDAGLIDPIGTLTQLAAAKEIRSRAAVFRIDGADNEEFPQDQYIDEDFWHGVNAGAANTQIYGDAGVFATTVIEDPGIGHHSERYFIWLSGVTFHAEDLMAFLKDDFKSGLSASPKPTQGPKRTPSVKKGHPPTDDQILGKADEMHENGMTSRDIAKMMCHEPGFENVSTVAVREVLKGRWPRGRIKKTTI